MIKSLVSQISNIFKDENFNIKKVIQVKAILSYLFVFITIFPVFAKSEILYEKFENFGKIFLEF
jgi:hypothetical protein